MTAFHQVMPTYSTMDPNDDIMEDSIYANQQQAIEDIDIDFEFNDDPVQDEQMGEGDADVGDYSAGAAQPGFDDDDEMADDEQIHTLESVNRQSALQQPAFDAVVNSSAEVFMAEPPNVEHPDTTTDATADDILVDFGRDFEVAAAVDSSNEPQYLDIEPPVEKSFDKNLEIETFTSGTEENAHPNIDLVAPSADLKLEEGHGPSLTQQINSFEATNDLDLRNAEVAASFSVSGTTQVNTDSLQQGFTPQAQSEGVADSTKEAFNESKGTVLGGDASKDTGELKLQSDPSSVLQSTLDSVNGSKPEVPPDGSFSGQNTESEKSPVEGVEHEENEEHDEPPAHEAFNDLAIIVEYDGQELSLFPPHSDEASDTFLLSDHGLLEQDLCTLIAACKPVLSTDSMIGEELVLTIPSLGLEIAESAGEATTTTLAHLRDTYVHLSHNDGIELPDPLRLELFTKQKMSSQLERLLAFVEQGKGLTALIQESPQFAENDFAEGLEDAGERNSKGAPHIVTTEGDGSQQDTSINQGQPTFAAEVNGRSHREETPEDPEGDHDDFLDFRSPMHQPHDTPSKPSGFPRDQALDRPNRHDPHRQDFLTQNDAAVEFDDFDDEPGEQHVDAEAEQLFQPDLDLSVSEYQGQQEAQVESGVSSKNETKDLRTTANFDSVEIKGPASSALLEGENDFITGEPFCSYGLESFLINHLDEPEKPMDSLDKDKSLDGPDQEFSATTLPQEQDDGFDFDDFLEDQGSAPGLESDDNEVGTSVKTTEKHDQLPELFRASEPVSSTPAHGDGDSPKREEQTQPEEDEIDFSDDEPDKQPEPAATTTQTKSDSLKRMRPLEEDVDALEASPSKRTCWSAAKFSLIVD